MYKLEITLCIGLTVALEVILILLSIRCFFDHIFIVGIISGTNRFIAACKGFAIRLEIVIIGFSIRVDKLQETISKSLAIFLEIVIIRFVVFYLLCQCGSICIGT